MTKREARKLLHRIYPRHKYVKGVGFDWGFVISAVSYKSRYRK